VRINYPVVYLDAIDFIMNSHRFTKISTYKFGR
jgi:hypothetical protein